MAACFLLPFALRGARNAMDNMQNDVKNWLPSDYPETADLHWFGEHFLGEQFVLITWDGCTENDDSFKLLVANLKKEIIFADVSANEPWDESLSASERAALQAARDYRAELVRARETADRLGLYSLDDFNENFAGRQERWLAGNDKQRYFITPDGTLWRSLAGDDLISRASSGFRRAVLKDHSVAAEVVDQFGADFVGAGETNDFYADPSKLTSRYFTSIRTGPDVIEELAGENGVLKPRGQNLSDEERTRVAEMIALNRLTGTLFAPAVPAGFEWTENAMRRFLLPQEQKLAEFPTDWVAQLEVFKLKAITEDYAGDATALLQASPHERAILWYRWFDEIQVQASTMFSVRRRARSRMMTPPIYMPLKKILHTSNTSYKLPMVRLLRIRTASPAV